MWVNIKHVEIFNKNYKLAHLASRLTHTIQKGRKEERVSHTRIQIHIHTNSYTKDHIHLVSNSNDAQDNRYTRFKITPQLTHAPIHNT